MTLPIGRGPTNYEHPFPNYQLRDLVQAMDYNAAGQPIIRVSTGSSGNGNVVINGNTGSDAFGRTRISEPVTLFDSQNRYLDGQQFASKTASGGTVTYNANGSNFTLAITAASGSSVIRQCKTVQLYQPGKSLLVMNTFAYSTLQANTTQRVGYFTSGDGIYFEAEGTNLYLVIRSSVTGSVVNTRIAQTDWNQDPLNGEGVSGIDLDPTKTQIFWCDIEWLGVGSVRAGFVINGVFVIAHVFNHANLEDNVYMTTAILNCRYEIFNTAAAAASSSMLQICSTVISEGGYSPQVQIGYIDNGTAVTRISSANTVTSLAAVRLNPSYPDAVVIPSQVDLLCTDVRYGQWQLILNPSNTFTWGNVANSVVQTSANAFSITDGTVLYAGLLSSRDEVEIGPELYKRLQLGRDVDGNSDVIVLAVSFTQTNTDLLYKFGWQELS